MNRPLKISWLESPEEFPPTSLALKRPNGILAASACIDPDWLEASYRRGIFPWYSDGEPVLWWTPSPRAVLYTVNFKLHRSLRKVIKTNQKKPERQITLNHDFEGVMRQCAQPRNYQEGTWITEEVIAAYVGLHRKGLAHSVEHWEGSELIGGLYCVAMGKMVYGESMFARQTDASKVAFAYFVYWLKRSNVRIIDCQQATRHLMSFGAEEIGREVFERELDTQIDQPPLDWRPSVLDWQDDPT